MSYSDLLSAVAKDAGIPSAAELVSKHGHKYLHLIKSRERARELIGAFTALLDTSLKGKKLLELGSGVGSLSIEFAHLGAEVTAIEPSVRWMGMAEEHARNEAKVNFVRADLLHSLSDFPEKSFDIVVTVDSLPKIYDLHHAAERLHGLIKPGGALAFRVPSGSSPASVDDRRGLGLPLVPPDYWSAFVKAPIGQYHRPWGTYRALFKEAGFAEPVLSVAKVDESLERAKYKIRAQLSVLKKKLKEKETLSDPKAYIYARNALKPYIRGVERDLEALSWDELNLRYRAPTWVGVARVPA
ncbi:MAG TPA: class I SAM-dependent methyltransferase [Rhizomicrobium sp.]|nr:class I SAM-dependent methyltransferase [Rhizomicrobium sp.]